MASTQPTIFALSSGRPPVAIAVIRISGPRAGAALAALGIKIPEPRKAGLARIRDPRSGEIIDEALVLWFPGPHSETGEDVAELQAHGGRAVIAAVLDALAHIEGLRMAEPGEFTRRGFENGKLDLTAVEGLADLVGAETEAQRRQAFRQMKGLLGDRADAWRRDIIKALALVEARIDFSDEADVPEDLVTPALAMARGLRDEIATVLADGQRGERLREGLVVAIAGPPNAGKSTLLNRLARREAAIVSPYAGTTRDVIEIHLDLGGFPVTLLDTAGIRDTTDPVEMEGVRRARERAVGADLVLWVVDGSAGEFAGATAVTPGDAGNSDLNRTAPTVGVSPDALALVKTAVPDVSRSSRAVPDGGDLETATTQASAIEGRSTGMESPSVWLVRNKVDLMRDVGTSERETIINRTNEHTSIFCKSSPGHDNSDSAANSESLFLSLFFAESSSPVSLEDSSATHINSEPVFNLSALSGEGFDLLLAQMTIFAESFLSGAEQSVVTRARHRRALEDALAALERALVPALGEDLLAEELRAAAYALGRLTGRVDVEDVLDVIFRDFCIGK